MKTLTQLCEKYDTTDSISLREELNEEIVEVVRDYIETLLRLHIKYEGIVSDGSGICWSGTDYRKNSGTLSLSEVYKIGEDYRLIVVYEDSWSYGGSCYESYSISANHVDNLNLAVIEKRYRYETQQKLRRDKEALEKDIERIEEELSNYN